VAGVITKATGGTLYNIATLGGKVWLAEDLKAGTSPITIVGNGLKINEIPSLTKGVFTWAEAVDANNPVCPEGWHLSTEAEWAALALAAGSYAGLNLRDNATSASGWTNYSTAADSVFGAKVPASVGTFNTASLVADDEAKLRVFTGAAATATNRGANKFNVWWTEVQLDTNNAYVRSIQEAKMTVERDSFNKLMNQFSVRCVKD
jgi:uncharacterized protein (TIGR02145 family)